MKAEFKNAWGYQGDNMNLPVHDVEAAIPFYENTMGFRLMSRTELPHKAAVLGRDNIRIGLAENGGDSSQDGCAFEVDNAELALVELRSNGLQKELSALEIEERDGTAWKAFYAVAPDGLCYWIGERLAKD